MSFDDIIPQFDELDLKELAIECQKQTERAGDEQFHRYCIESRITSFLQTWRVAVVNMLDTMHRTGAPAPRKLKMPIRQPREDMQ